MDSYNKIAIAEHGKLDITKQSIYQNARYHIACM